MLNKEEIMYNSESLVSAWLEDKENVKNLTIELINDTTHRYYPIEKNECGNRIGEFLYKNDGKYKLLTLTGEIDGKREIIGSIDII